MSNRIKQSLSFLENIKKIPLDLASVDCLFSSKSFKTELLTQIANARVRIYLVALYLEADEAGKEILMALYQAKKNNPNLDIVVCVDYHRAQRGLIGEKKAISTNATWYQEVEKTEATGIKIIGIPVKRKELFGVQHLKGYIFDDRVLYSGASFNNIYLHQQDRYRYDRYWILNNQELANSMVLYLQNELLSSHGVTSLNSSVIKPLSEFKRANKGLTKSLKKASYSYQGISSSEQLSVAPLSGLGARNNKLNKSIRKLLQSAKHEFVLFTPYFNLPATVSRDINSLLKRGVKLTIVVGDKTANDFYIEPDKPFRTIAALPYLYENNLKKFAKKHQTLLVTGQLQLNLWQHEKNSFHLKGLYCDNRFVLLTGHNLNPRAWRLDVENGLLIDDPAQSLKSLLEKELQTILNNSRQITDASQIEGVEDYPTPVKKLLVRMRRIKADNIVKGLI